MKYACFTLVLLLSISAIAAPPAEEGKSIFTTRCAGCHNVNKIMTGPALAGVDERRSMDWIINFVHSSQSVIKSGDETAVALYNQFNKIPMPDHPDLTADHIKSIVEYIKTAAASADKPAFKKPLKAHPDYKPLSADDSMFFLAYLALAAVLVAALLFAVHMKTLNRP